MYSGRLLLRGIGRLLPAAAIIVLCSGCDVFQQAAKGIGEAFGGGPQAANQQAAVPGQPGQMATKQDIDKLWNSYSEEDRKLLSDTYMDRSSLDSFEGTMDIATIQMMLDGNLQYMRPLKLHPAGCVVGTALSWRELDSYEAAEGEYMTLISGNFDADADSELVILREGLELIELDGSRRPLGGFGTAANLISNAWDYDGDGVDELLGLDATQLQSGDVYDGESMATQDTVVYSPAGEKLATLPGSLLFGQSAQVDIDGDGRSELLLAQMDMDQWSMDIHAYGRRGKEVWAGKSLGMGMGGAVVSGDIDGDGKSELLSAGLDPASGAPGRVMAYGMGQEPAAINGLTDNSLAGEPLGCLDLDGDGRAEVIVGAGALNTSSGERTRLKKPGGFSEMQLGAMGGVGVGAIVWNGQPCLAARVMEGVQEWRSDTLVIWNAAGEIVYQEFLGGELQDLRIVPSSTGERIVLQMQKRLLVSDAGQ